MSAPPQPPFVPPQGGPASAMPVAPGRDGSRKGRGMVIWGAALLVISIVGAVVGTTVLGSGVSADLLGMEDVAIDGSSDRLVPGEISFSVLEPLGDDEAAEMTVGVAVGPSSGPEPTCTIEDSNGDDVPLDSARSDDLLLDETGRYEDFEVLGHARLGPGDYTAACAAEGEPSASAGTSFTVGRVLTVDDVFGMLGPVFGILAVLAVAGMVFLVGLVLLIVGLVQRSKARRQPQGPTSPPYGPPGAWSQPGAPQPGPYGAPGPYGQQAPYQPGPYGAPGPYGQQAPYQPGPYGAPGPSQPDPHDQPGPQGRPVPPPWPGPHPDQPAPGAPPPSGRASAPPAPGQSTPPPPAPEGDDGSSSGWTIPPSKR